jgi:glycosyltransferase involved in cell wall biosynthesis
MEKRNLIKYKNKLKLENVEFRESVIKKSVPTILAEADILIISQRRISLYKYGFSYNKLFDFMAAAKPIIFAGNSSNDPVVEGGCGISILPENPEKMAEAIIKLYKMAPEEREKIGKKGREYVEKYHSIPVLVDKLEEVIKEIVNE